MVRFPQEREEDKNLPLSWLFCCNFYSFGVPSFKCLGKFVPHSLPDSMSDSLLGAAFVLWPGKAFSLSMP